SHYAEGPGKN
nr:RecName: Full=Cytochrome c oxidase polypeptide 7C, mitochondrial; AltName: Full=Cytochrome c oxidase polypeptide VIIc [Thunnus obesus]